MAMFEIYRDNKLLYRTDYERLIPPAEILIDMKKRGYTFKRNGRRFVPKAK